MESFWFAVHALVGYFPAEGWQGSILVHENVVLCQASDRESAGDKVDRMMRSVEESPTNLVYVDDRPAIRNYIGVRKIVACDDGTEQPRHLTEITYTALEFADKDHVNRYAAGENCNLICVDKLEEDIADEKGNTHL